MQRSDQDPEPYTHPRLDYHATVRELPSGERPRERLQSFGAGALSTAELLAIALRTGTRGDNALTLANRLLVKYGGPRRNMPAPTRLTKKWYARHWQRSTAACWPGCAIMRCWRWDWQPGGVLPS